MIDEKISIIVPVYNVEKYIPTCLDSIINQTHKNLEIICVNDGSTDNSLIILRRYAEADNRVNVINKENEGVSKARNVALEKATGEYILFVDGDDWIELDTVESALQSALQNDADIVMWSYIREFNHQSKPKKIFENDMLVFQKDEVKTKLHRRFVGLLDEELAKPENADALSPCWMKFYSSRILKDNQIFFRDIREIGTYEDGLFNLEVFYYVNKVVYIDKYFYHYRKTNSESVTSEYKKDLYEKWQNLFDIMAGYIDKHNLSDDYKKALQNRIALSIIGLGLNILSSDMSVFKKNSEINRIISNEKYRSACEQLCTKYFPFHWKLFFFCAKNKLVTILYFLLLSINMVRGK